MKYLLFLTFIFLEFSNALGATSESTYDSYSQAMSANLGFWEGGIAFGGEYENAFHRTFGLGGTLRYYSRDSGKSNAGSSSRLVIGGFIRPHFNRREWDFYVSPGINFMMIDGNKNDRTLLTPSVNYGLLYQIKSNVAIGIQNSQFYCWFDADNRGAVLFDLLAQGRFSF